MHVLIIDSSAASRAELSGRVMEAIKQADIKRVDPLEVSIERLSEIDQSAVLSVLVGPGLYADLAENCQRVRSLFPNKSIGVVLENQTYATEGVFLRKNLGLAVMPLGDMAQIAGFVMDSQTMQAQLSGMNNNRGVIGCVQFKGGVGVTTVSSSLAACWARHGLSVALLDMDDVGAQITAWARVGSNQRSTMAEFMRLGEVPSGRLNEIAHPVESFEGRLVVIGQPERYNEAFHFKADVLDGAPSSGEFVTSLISHLRGEFDIVVIDLSRSWGVAALSLLTLCNQVLLVTDDDGLSVKVTLDGLARFKRESDDPAEFDLTKWNVILNAYTGRLIEPKDLAQEIKEVELLPPESNLYAIPFSEKGRQWGAPGQTLYDLAEDSIKAVIRKVAYGLVPFRYDVEEMPVVEKLVKKWQNAINSAVS